MKFDGFFCDSKILGNLEYISEEYSFDFCPKTKEAVTSISIDTLQISIDSQGRLLSVWGCHPYTIWKQCSLNPPIASSGKIYVRLNEITPGVSERFIEFGEWVTLFDPESGWIYIGNSNFNMEATSKAIEFASACIGIVGNDTLQAIWLHIKIEKCNELRQLIK